MSDKKEVRAWDFVERYYPYYHSSDTIGRFNDIEKLILREYEEGDCAHRLLISDYNGDIKNKDIILDASRLIMEIFKTSIESFILQGGMSDGN